MRRALLCLLPLGLTACPSRPAPTPDAHVVAAPAVDAGPATHVCYGPGGSAVEVGRATACASLGGSDTPPVEVPNAPAPPAAVRRDGGTPLP